jgi:L-methionine (R)-S-oxide reductase
MHVTQRYDFKDKAADYVSLAGELASLLASETDLIANAANTSALLFDAIPDISWAGFYFLRGDELVVGPFQGKPACVRICMGKGVCGAAAQQRSTLVVPDVDAFPGHIACDAASRSEIVIPLISKDALWGVLDIDSSTLARFDEVDRHGLEQLVAIFIHASRP